MARKARVTVNNNYVHVLTVGNDGIRPFADNKMKKTYLECIMYSIKKYNITLIAYSIMDSHSHLLFKVSDKRKLSYFMTYLNSMFARIHNKELSHDGKVFKDRFKAEIIDGRMHICECIKFIQSDPLRLQIVDKLELYRYTSYYEYQNDAILIDLVDSGRHFNPSPRAMQSMMKTPSEFKFLECILRSREYDDTIFEYVINKYNVLDENDLNDVGILYSVAKAIRELTYMNISELSIQLGVSIEKILSVLVD